MIDREHRPFRLLPALAAGGVLAACAACAPSPSNGGWSYFGGDHAYTRYAPLDQIDSGNVSELEIAWRRPAADSSLTADHPFARVPRYLLSAPILVDGVLFAPNALGLVEAFDPGTGGTVWVQRPVENTLEEVTGRSTRGVDHWADGSEARVVSVRGEYLYALDAETGEPAREFGDGGRVRLTREGPEALPYSWTSGPIVVGDVVVVGGQRGGAGDRSRQKERDPEDVTGWDVRTGERLWTFHVIPREGEPGTETWEKDSWKGAGDGGSWCCLSADDELGYVYVPTSSATGFYGGWRPGDNLYTNSLVALDATTGERVWHYQTIHHGIWEYENPAPPVLGDVTIDGEERRIVMLATKTNFLFVLDRVTGEPIWPVEEQPVPPSTVPGEVASPTQPFPTRPAPFDRHGVTDENLADFTPGIRDEIREFVDQYVTGPVFTPPSVRSEDPDGTLGTLSIPSSWGGANWNTGAFDPETGYYYAVSHTLVGEDALIPAEKPDETIPYVRVGSSPVRGPDGLPITKPPYGRITAIDMATGEHAWMVPNGDGPRDHPRLRDLDLPPLGIPGRPTPLVTGTLLFLGEGSDAIAGIEEGMWGRMFRAYDKATGEVVWERELPGGTTSQPASYMYEGRQYLVVPIGDSEHPTEWVALSLPE